MHDSSVQGLRKFLASISDQGLVVADIGCYDESRTYEGLVKEKGLTYVGIDARSGPNVDYVVDDGYQWFDVPGDSFDLVISGQTLEHVPKPWLWIHAINRILKPGGRVWIAAPNTWEFHEVPKDCWRVWPDGMIALLEEGGFTDISAYKEGPDTFGVGRKR